MFTGTLWPAHPHPYQGECLSCWLVRCAHANGMKAQTFCDRAFGKEHQIWNRDIDRLAPEWLCNIMSEKTGTTKKATRRTTFKLYEKRLFPILHPASQLRWVIPLKLYHRKHLGYAMQYCPMCLTEDKEAYYRLQWRLALYTFCPKHRIYLHDRCHTCGAPVSFHRIEQGKYARYETETLDQCWQCESKLSEAERAPLEIWCKDSFKIWIRVLGVIDRQFINSGPINYDRLTLLHQICRLLVSPSLAPKLQHYICYKCRIEERALGKQKKPFEQRGIVERQYVLELAWWLVGCTQAKIRTTITARALKTSDITRDLSPVTKSLLSSLYFPQLPEFF